MALVDSGALHCFLSEGLACAACLVLDTSARLHIGMADGELRASLGLAHNIKVYFAHPHSPWERGTSENTNMLIRDFFPKGTDFSKVSAYRLKRVENLLNDRPREVLNFYTPKEVFTQSVALKN